MRENAAAVSPISSRAITLNVADEAATARLAMMVADSLRPGDLVTLDGDLGSGKTTFSRYAIRHLAGDARLEVPSPTFTLIQTYDVARGTVVHADLYRLGDPGELAEIGWDEAGADAIVLVEWPERAGDALPEDRLAVHLALDPAEPRTARTMTLEGHGRWAGRLARLLAVQHFLDIAGWGDAQRQHLQGDASSRAYERLTNTNGEKAILMNAPRRPDGPPVHHGKSYSQVARLAEDVRPFVALAQGLRERGFCAPEIYASDLERGLLLLEDFGSEGILVNGEPISERHAVAVDALVRLHSLALPETLPVDEGLTHTIPAYDIEALSVEAELFVEWYLPRVGVAPDDAARARFFELWREALEPILAEPLTWTLRDYHSPNLMWMEDREGLNRLGLLDFQDAVMGPPAYDLVSLLQDARVDVPQALELHLLSRYVGGRRMHDVEFDAADFARSYAVLGAQRATKILGIFVRLDVRDGKPGYLKHIPRILRYLERDLAHPGLAGLKAWYDEHLPPSETSPAS